MPKQQKCSSCSSGRCSNHVFELKPMISHLYFGKIQKTRLCPRLNKTTKQFQVSIPLLNRDRKYYTPSFILEEERSFYFENDKKMLKSHEQKVEEMGEGSTQQIVINSSTLLSCFFLFFFLSSGSPSMAASGNTALSVILSTRIISLIFLISVTKRKSIRVATHTSSRKWLPSSHAGGSVRFETSRKRTKQLMIPLIQLKIILRNQHTSSSFKNNKSKGQDLRNVSHLKQIKRNNFHLYDCISFTFYFIATIAFTICISIKLFLNLLQFGCYFIQNFVISYHWHYFIQFLRYILRMSHSICQIAQFYCLLACQSFQALLDSIQALLVVQSRSGQFLVVADSFVILFALFVDVITEGAEGVLLFLDSTVPFEVKILPLGSPILKIHKFLKLLLKFLILLLNKLSNLILSPQLFLDTLLSFGGVLSMQFCEFILVLHLRQLIQILHLPQSFHFLLVQQI